MKLNKVLTDIQYYFCLILLISISDFASAQNTDSSFIFKPSWIKGETQKYTFDYVYADNRKVESFALIYTGEFKVIKKTKSGYLVQFTFFHISNQDFFHSNIAGMSTYMNESSFKYKTDRNGKITNFVGEKKFKKKLWKCGISMQSWSHEPSTIKGSTITLPKGALDNLNSTIMLGGYFKDKFMETILKGIFFVHKYYNTKTFYEPKFSTINIENNWDGDSLECVRKEFYFQHKNNIDQISVFNSSSIDYLKANEAYAYFYSNFCDKDKLNKVKKNEGETIVFKNEAKIDINKKANWIHLLQQEEWFGTNYSERVERFIIE